MRGIKVGIAVIWGAAWFASSLASAAITVVHRGSEVTYHVTIDKFNVQPVILSGKSFSKVTLDGLGSNSGILYREGQPEIPVARFVVEGGSIQVQEVATLSTMSLPARNLQLVPVQRSATKIRGDIAAFRMDMASYRRETFEPARAFEVKKLGSVRGVPRNLVTLYPVAYNASTGEVHYRKAFQIRAQSETDGFVADDSSKIGMAIIVADNLAKSPSLEKYVQAKEAADFRIQVLTVHSGQTPDEIRAQLRQLYLNKDFNLRYALVVGDADMVPAYESHTISGVTDHYYASLDVSDYDSDILTPDIAVGRFSATNETELNSMVEKSLTYLSGTFANGDWSRSAAFLATDDRYEVAEGTHNYAISTFTKPAGYFGIFPAPRQEGGDQLYAITHHVSESKVLEAFKLGRSIINYSGHGANTFWDAPRVSQEDVRSLDNPNSLPFVISNACITGDFRVDESFAETWSRHRFGAIMFWGSMDNTLWDEDDILERRMYDGIFQHQRATFGEITTYALEELTKFYGGDGNSRYYFETYHMFGDPSLSLRASLNR